MKLGSARTWAWVVGGYGVLNVVWELVRSRLVP